MPARTGCLPRWHPWAARRDGSPPISRSSDVQHGLARCEAPCHELPTRTPSRTDPFPPIICVMAWCGGLGISLPQKSRQYTLSPNVVLTQRRGVKPLSWAVPPLMYGSLTSTRWSSTEPDALYYIFFSFARVVTHLVEQSVIRMSSAGGHETGAAHIRTGRFELVRHR